MLLREMSDELIAPWKRNGGGNFLQTWASSMPFTQYPGTCFVMTINFTVFIQIWRHALAYHDAGSSYQLVVSPTRSLRARARLPLSCALHIGQRRCQLLKIIGHHRCGVRATIRWLGVGARRAVVAHSDGVVLTY